MDIKDCGIKTPAERSIRHSDISVGKGVTGKSAIPYETAQCSARTEFPVLASPRPFLCFYAALHRHTSICTSGYSISAARYTPACRFPHVHARCFPHAYACSPFPGFPHTHAHSHFRCVLAFPCVLAVSRTPARCFPHAHACSRFPAPARCLALPPPPRASSSASRFPSASAPFRLASLRLAGKAEPGANDKTGYRTSRVWIWSSKNGRQGGVGQPSQEWYQYDEETNSVQEE
ncbi:hypothetical protein B0H13DRAFT_2367573 [Mycena leptocephala]|nr:hypothetical protein B0H13DRAFT_2367573 [Mycena leptocephala]